LGELRAGKVEDPRQFLERANRPDQVAHRQLVAHRSGRFTRLLGDAQVHDATSPSPPVPLGHTLVIAASPAAGRPRGARSAGRLPHCAGQSAQAVPPHRRRRHWTPWPGRRALDCTPCPSLAPLTPLTCPYRAPVVPLSISDDGLQTVGAMPVRSRSLDLSLICSRVLGSVRARAFLIDDRLERGSLQYLQCDGVRKPVVYSDQKSKPSVGAPQARDLTRMGAVSLHLPSARRQAARDRAQQVGTPGDS
jgi:hypothetical protein